MYFPTFIPTLPFNSSHSQYLYRSPPKCGIFLPSQTISPSPSGPCCPLIDRDLLRHCVNCTNKCTRKASKSQYVSQLLNSAKTAIHESQRGKAEILFLRAIVADPSKSKSYFLFALQVQRRDPTLARELFFQGVRVNPMDARLLQAWGLFESKQGRRKRAQMLVKRSVQLEPKNKPVLRWKCLFPDGAPKID